MNIVKLEHEQEIEVINAAVRILRQRIVGSIDRIEHIEQEFLATSLGDDMKTFSSISPGASTAEKDEFIKKGKPISLEVMSICRAIQEAVFGLIKKDRPHVEKPTISEDAFKILGEKVIRIFNAGKKERIMLPLRFAEVVDQRMKKNNENTDQIRHQLVGCFREYFNAKTQEARARLFITIGEYLKKIHDFAEQNREDEACYDLSALKNKPDIDEVGNEEEKYKPGNIFDTGGGIDMHEMIVDDDFRLEMEKNIPYSEAEKELMCYMPKEIREDPWIISDVYYWHAYGEEWQRETLDMQKSAPDTYIDMLESTLVRKFIIFAHAHQKLEEEKKKFRTGTANKKLCSKIEDYLPDLHDEIDALLDNIEKRRAKITTRRAVEQPKNKLSDLEASFSRLRGKYSRALHNFLDIEGYENYEEVEALEKSLIIAYNDLESYCLKHGQQSHMLGRDREDANTEAAEGVLTIDTYLESPNYFTHFPEALRTPKSEHEKILEMACGITLHSLFRYPQNTSTIELIYQEDDGSESPEIEKMKLIKSIVQSFIERKTAIYFHASKWLEENENEEVQHHKYALEDEILHLENALQIISRRIRWADDASQKYPELRAEIDYLAQERHKLLWRFILAPSEETQYPLSGRIKELTQVIADRNVEISSGNRQHKTPHSTIPAEPLSESEGGLCPYVPISVRKSEKILFGRTIPYFPEKRGSQVQDHSWEKEKQRFNHHLERKMMIYFYARQRISSIDEALINASDHDAEKLFLEREFIEENIYQLSQEIDDLSEHIKQVNIYSGERCEEQTEEEKIDALAHKAMSLHAELDGIIAHSDDDFGKKVERYWFTLQRYLLRFRTRLMIQKEKGETHKITQIQAEFNQEMHFIILDMQDALDSLHASRKKRERMIGTVEKIRTAVFGHREDAT